MGESTRTAPTRAWQNSSSGSSPDSPHVVLSLPALQSFVLFQQYTATAHNHALCSLAATTPSYNFCASPASSSSALGSSCVCEQIKCTGLGQIVVMMAMVVN